MSKIRKCIKNLEDCDVIGPKDLFGAFIHNEKADSIVDQIEITEHNLMASKFLQPPSFGSQIASPKSTSQFKKSQDLPLNTQNNLISNRRMNKDKKSTILHNFQNSLKNNHEEKIRKRKKWQQLKYVLANQKINVLKQIFIQKIKRNNPYSPPVEFQINQQFENQSILESQGVQLSQSLDHLFSVILIIELISSFFIFTLALVFQEVARSQILFILQITSLIIAISEITINFIHQRTISGRRVKILREIINNYVKNQFPIDFINLLALVLSMSTKNSIFSFIRIVSLTKYPQIMDRLQKLEIYVIDNFYREQYWSLAKTIFFNFCGCHILALLLIAMSHLNSEENWLIQKQIVRADWIQKYVWSYYWGTNIMLTVGFGDINASTYQEAICLIFIEMISCLVLAYNINCIGNLISNIRAQDIEKSKNFKIFKKLIIKNNLPQDLSCRINNYIDESINIKKKFSLEEEKNFIQKLPSGFKKEVLKESNKAIFQKLTFFHNLMEKTLFSLAEKIEVCICHPEQVIQSLQDNFNTYILKAGEIGYVCKKQNSNYHNRVIDYKKITTDDTPFLVNLHFITKKRPNHEVKSMVYSILYYLDYDKLISILNQSPMDYELYAYLRDKNKNVIDQFQVFPCEFCKTKHTKFDCPKLHFIPITQHVINKYLRVYAYGKNQRFQNPCINRRRQQNALVYYQSVGRIQQISNDTGVIQWYKSKKSHLISERLRKKRQQVPQQENTINIMQSKFLENTTEIIREQIAKVIGSQQYYDEVWNIKIDEIKNYKSYFTRENSCNIRQRISRTKNRPSKDDFLTQRFISRSFDGEVWEKTIISQSLKKKFYES